MVDVFTILSVTLQIIGGATILLKMIAPLTKNKTDDHILKIIEKLLSLISLDSNSKEIKIKLK